jgi:hypothetical protein
MSNDMRIANRPLLVTFSCSLIGFERMLRGVRVVFHILIGLSTSILRQLEISRLYSVRSRPYVGSGTRPTGFGGSILPEPASSLCGMVAACLSLPGVPKAEFQQSISDCADTAPPPEPMAND